MVAYNFKLQFAADVKSGKKLRTIRRKARAKVGDALQLYTGMMHKRCRKLRDAICTAVQPIEIHDHAVFMGHYTGYYLTAEESDEFARLDGFTDYEAMVLFFKKTYPKDDLPIQMHVTEWNPLP